MGLINTGSSCDQWLFRGRGTNYYFRIFPEQAAALSAWPHLIQSCFGHTETTVFSDEVLSDHVWPCQPATPQQELLRSSSRESTSTMKTLYDLLGALPDDDAEEIRTAFRKAAKATHPDTNAGDPDAPLRFRQIVRANAILSDAEQRAAYDRLLALTRLQPRSSSKRSFTSDTIRKLASDAIVVTFLSIVIIGGYTLFGHISKASVIAVNEASAIPAKAVEVVARAPAEAAATAPTEQLDTAANDQPRDKSENAAAANEAMVPNAVAAAADTGSTQIFAQVFAQAVAGVGPASVPAAQDAKSYEAKPHDAKSYRERGIFAYRDGDLTRAIADFDLAIQHDPGSADAYIDRGIVLYRMHEFERAFADIAQAKRIESSNRTKTASRKATP
jgi:tetratricopeptide (TPR) repeat protein